MQLPFKIKDLGKLFKTAYKKWNEKDPFRQSAIIAYYAIFSLPALLVVVISAAGLFFDAEAVNGHVMDQISKTMGKQTSEQIKEMLVKASVAKSSIWATIIGIAVLLIGATGVFVQLQKTLNIIWEVKAVPKKGIWPMLKARLFSFGLILSIAFLLLVSLVISTILGYLSKSMSAESSDFMIIVFRVLNFIISLLVISMLFALMFKILPDAEIKWRHVWIGSIVTGLLFTLGKSGLAFYFSKAEPGEGYGAAGSIILILLWVSYSSMIMFFGAEFTRAYADLYSDYTPPSDLAEKDDAPSKAL
jgi:membrane protein